MLKTFCRHLTVMLLLLTTCATIAAQGFSSHRTDTTSSQKEVPIGLYVWTVDSRFGDITQAEVDTLPHLYPQTTMGTGRYMEYNTVGSNYTARQNRIFMDRRATSQFLLTDAWDQSVRPIDSWHFTNTLSPITNLGYDNCGDKTNGEDHLDARFAVNAGKRTGLGFDLDYQYARGYFQNQNVSHFGATFYASHLGDRYQLHALFSTHHQKSTENGGVTNDDYVTHPELYTESYADNEIPTVLASNWNRNDMQRLFLTHRYSLGFYRQVPMTEEERKAKEFALESAKENAERAKRGEDGDDDDDSRRSSARRSEEAKPMGRPDNAKIAGDAPKSGATADSLAADTTRIRVDSKLMADSLMAIEAQTDSAELFMKREFVPVTSFIHTLELQKNDRKYQAYESPADYYADTYYNISARGGYSGDSIFDQTKFLHLRNTLALALLEGFNKYAAAGLKAFVSHDLRRFDMPDTDDAETAYLHRWTEHSVSLGGQLQKAQGRTLHYDVVAETWVAGEDAGQLKLDGRADVNFALLGDTMRLEARAYLHRMNPTFLQRRYHSKHLWWDEGLEKETRSRVEGTFTFAKTKTKLRVAVEEIQNYTYLGMGYTLDGEQRRGLTARFMQHGGNLNVMTAQLDQRLSLGPLHWDNVLTYQSASNDEVLPLPKLNVFTNLYLEFWVAHVLRVELGGAATWFTKYEAPDFLPQLNSFAVQQEASARRELGNFPFVDVYANLHLKHARFFVMMSNAGGTSFNRQSFLAPHYPVNRSVLHMGVSWNFFN